MSRELLLSELQCDGYQNARVPTNIKTTSSQILIFGKGKEKDYKDFKPFVFSRIFIFLAQESPDSALH